MPIVFADLSTKAESDESHQNAKRLQQLPKHILEHLTYMGDRGWGMFENPDVVISSDFTSITINHGKTVSDWIMSQARDIEAALGIQIIIHTYSD
jgi:hypothetical protein